MATGTKQVEEKNRFDEKRLTGFLERNLEEFQSVTVGQLVVDERDIGTLCDERLERMATIGRLVHLKVVRFQEVANGESSCRVVVKHQHFVLRHEDGFRRESLSTVTIGRSTVATAPPAGAFSNDMRASCSSTIRRTIASPKPVPPFRPV